MAISLNSVSLEYPLNNGTVLNVFREQSLDVADHEFIGIVGESGCGKTSLLRLIAGLTDPTSGTVTINGKSPASMLKARKVALLFQHPVLLPWKTVVENARLPGRLNRDSQAVALAEEALALVGLSDFLNAYPAQLSGGMQARAAIARALVQQPEILLMDEPFGALDEITRTRMNFELLRIWSEARQSVVFVTHSVEECVLLSDRVFLMAQRPEGIVEEVEITLPRPRTAATLESPEYMRIVGELRHRLQAVSHVNGRAEA